MNFRRRIWVTCPNCGNKKNKARFGELYFECKCGTAFTTYIANGIQATVIDDGENNTQEDYNPLLEFIDKFRSQLEMLALS